MACKRVMAFNDSAPRRGRRKEHNGLGRVKVDERATERQCCFKSAEATTGDQGAAHRSASVSPTAVIHFGKST